MKALVWIIGVAGLACVSGQAYSQAVTRGAPVEITKPLPLPVQVVNPRPVPITGQVTVLQTPYAERGQCFGQATCAVSFSAVPNGKRLVVLHASGFVQVQSPRDVVTGIPTVSLENANTQFHALPVTLARDQIYVMNQPALMYFQAGELPVVSIKGEQPLSASMNLSGYFVDAP